MTTDEKAPRCWLWTHSYTKWVEEVWREKYVSRKTGDTYDLGEIRYQSRHCLKCGRVQRERIW